MCYLRMQFYKCVELIGKLCIGLINPFLNKITIRSRNGGILEKKGKGERAVALKMLIILMRQSVPA